MTFRGTYINPLKTDQRNALTAIMDWLTNSKDPTFTLGGYAGTGKTYLMRYVTQQYKKPLCITAPTHKALKQVVRSTGIAGKTIHSLHGLRPNYNIEFNFNNLQFDTIGTPSLTAYSLIIVDEASMVTSGMKALNELRAKQYGVKVLYCGDPGQLPPIKENISSVFSIPGYNLTEIIRQQEGNPLLKILSAARSDVFTGKDTLQQLLTKTPTSFNEDGEGYTVLDRHTFTNTIIQYFGSNAFSNNVDFVRYGAFTNPNILAWNNAIRNALIPNAEDLITEHDLLTAYQTIVDENMSPLITNSDDYIIKDIVKRTTEDGFDVFSTQLTDDSGKSQMVSIVDHKAANFGKFLSRITKLQQRAKYAPAHERSKRWKEFYDYKENYLIMSPILIPGEQYPIAKDIDYGYGLTIHKLQGSTLENVFINLPDIMRFKNNMLNPLRQRLLYTAISRSNKRVVFLK